jgi:hypothetical protein
MSRWNQVDDRNLVAKLSSGKDRCSAVVSATTRGRFIASAQTNVGASTADRQRIWIGGGAGTARLYDNASEAKRDALRACGRMLRGLRG